VTAIEKPERRAEGVGAAIFTAVGLAAAFAFAARSALPMALPSRVVRTASLAGIGRFATFHWLAFLIVAGAALLGGAVTALFYRDGIPPLIRRLVCVGLLIGALLLYYGYIYV
jgi:hypothetical protein